MRNLVFVAVLLLGFCAVSAAQDVPQLEVFGGYNVLIPEDNEGDIDYFHGWEGTLVVNGNEYAGIAIDVSGAYASLEDEGEDLGTVSTYTFLFGPQVRIPVHEKITPFIRALFGAGTLRLPGDLEGNEAGQLNDNGFAMALGGGVDIHLNDMISIRPAQVEFLTWRLSGEWLNTARFGAGVVFKFGER
ncbi:MAG: outer membrane beta-barrel protein [Acidobacteria bacterium]|nr:outer membrane beta-barrel protein [Acidobacteriota bacterium]